MKEDIKDTEIRIIGADAVFFARLGYRMLEVLRHVDHSHMGSGSICTTRVVAGVGVPQLSAVYDVYSALKGTGVPLIARMS